MLEKFRDWLRVNPKRADWTAIFIAINLFFLANNTLGPLSHSIQTYSIIGAAHLGAHSLLYAFAQLEIRPIEMALNVATVVLFAALFGGLV